MANVTLKDVVKIYPYIDKKPKKSLFKKKKDEPVKKKINLQITEKGVVAVQQFNLDIKDGEFIVLVGPSGCGKSTTLRMIAGLETITEGELYIDGNLVNSVEPKDRDIAMVFQSYALYPHMTVYDNMAYSLKIKKTPKAEIEKKVMEAAEILDITEYLQRKPKNLSDGQRQRVAIGRAIVRNPKVLLMDEPLSNLDAKLRNQMRAELIKLRKRINTTFVYVTHDQVEAMTLGDRIVVMKDGFIQQVGTPQEVFDHPRNLFVSGFIGTPQMNYFEGKLIKQNDKYSVKINDYVVELSSDKQANLAANDVEEQDVTIGVRPDHINITEDGIDAHVDVAELMGTSYHLHLTSNEKDVIAIIPNDGTFASYFNKDLKVSFDGSKVHVFSKENDRNLEFINETAATSYQVKAEDAPASEVAASEPVETEASEVVTVDPVEVAEVKEVTEKENN
ncbi:MAG: sn-glycerol-3-phosphate ABC transporter ATP-binding protein UgpC [Acholeplasmatales bacterium]|nr:sn-glycerol-3-phosphate ABC transporter ATP-binding protein UgpC [Acholeplasmatales bacterium]